MHEGEHLVTLLSCEKLKGQLDEAHAELSRLKSEAAREASLYRELSAAKASAEEALREAKLEMGLGAEKLSAAIQEGCELREAVGVLTTENGERSMKLLVVG